MPPIYSKEWTERAVQARGNCRQGRTSPCEAACPAGNPIQKMHSLIAEGKPSEALDYLRARNPFPGVTGRVCPHPCEEKCNRAEYDEAMNIRGMERFAADNGRASPLKMRDSSGKSVAIIGSGPTGLTATYFLALLGHAVTVFEKDPVAGGLPRRAIPDFRLPKGVLDKEVGVILGLGVKIHTNVTVGEDISLKDILAAFDGCLVAVGLSKDRVLDIPGKEMMIPAVSWLTASTMEREALKGKSVIILGGGGVAMDCAFTAKRLKAKEVHMVFLEAEGEIAAPREEVEQALEEGVILHHAHWSRAVEQSGGGLTVKAVPIKSFSFDEAGRLKAGEAGGAPLLLTADTVICASGIMPDTSFLKGVEGVDLTPRGCLATDPLTCQTSHAELMAAGDIATGPSLVAPAIGQGRKAAIALHKRLCGLAESVNLDIRFDASGRLELSETKPLPEAHIVPLQEMVHLDYHEKAPRRKNGKAAGLGLPFAEIAAGLTPAEAEAEAARCLHCGHCIACGTCVESCPGHILEMTDDGPRVAYPGQCWHCGCCRIACPTGSIAYAFPLNTLL